MVAARGLPEARAEAARWLVNDPEVVALAGSSGVLDCAVNRKLYESAGIMSLTDWRQLMRKADLLLSSLSQGGYLSAQILVRALRHVDGPISRASVTRALRSLPAQEHGMVGMPFLIGNHAAHNPNRTTVPMRLQGGAWHIAAAQWITAPEALAPSP